MMLEGGMALVTGASRGIGRAVAVEFARAGARVALQYERQREAAERAAAALPGAGHVSIQADLGRPAEARRLVEGAVEALGGLTVVVNNAGIYRMHPPRATDWEAWEDVWARTLAVNLTGPAHVSYWAARHMTARGGGRIINISSRGAFRGEPDAPAYGASKAGMNAMSQSMAKALAGSGVLVFAVAPGWVRTDMALPHLEGPAGDTISRQSPLGRIAEPEEVARVALFLAADAPESMTGSILDVNGASYLRT